MFFTLIANLFYENDEFFRKVRIICPVVYMPSVYGIAGNAESFHHRGKFFCYVPAFKIKDSPGVFPLHPRDEPVKGCHGPGDNVVEFLVKIFSAGVDDSDIFKTYGLCHGFRHLHFLSNRIAEGEGGIREEDGKGDTRETAPGAEVEETERGDRSFATLRMTVKGVRMTVKGVRMTVKGVRMTVKGVRMRAGIAGQI